MDGFEQLANAARGEDFSDLGVYEEAKTYFQLKHMDQVLLVVASIEPRKEEIDLLTPDKVAKAPIHVPWGKGIVARLLPYKVRRRVDEPDGEFKIEEYTLFEGDEPSNLVINYDFYPIYEKLSERDITSGFTRLYDIVDNTYKTMKVTGFPIGFENWPPAKRFAFWWNTLSRKFAVGDRMEPGMAFWAYWDVRDLTHEKNEAGEQKYKYPFTSATKVIKNKDTGAYLEAIPTIERVPEPIIKEVLRMIDAKRTANASTPNGEDTIPF